MQAEFVSWITGPKSPTRTDTRAGVVATDLGISWDDGAGRSLIAFGDTYGRGWGGFGAGPKDAEWRCNVLARIPAPASEDGLELHWIYGLNGRAAQVLRNDWSFRQETVIPTAGIAFAGHQWMHAMSVRRWDQPGHWTTNYAALWVSDDDHSWSKTGVKWRYSGWGRSDGSRFQQGAFVHDGEYVLLFGTPAGRFGGGYLARSRDMRIWEYWCSSPQWSSDPGRATPIITGPVAELSVIWHRPTNEWFSLTLDENHHAIMLRSAPLPTGPWSLPTPVVSGRNWPGLYGGFFLPQSVDGDLWFTVSQWGPYNVMLFKLKV